MSRIPNRPRQSEALPPVIPYATPASPRLPSRPGLLTALGICGLVFGLLGCIGNIVSMIGAQRLFESTREPDPPPKVSRAVLIKPQLPIPPYPGDLKHPGGLFRPERERVLDVVYSRCGINLDRCEMLRRLLGECGELIFEGTSLEKAEAINSGIVESGTFPAGVDADSPPVFFRTRNGTVLLNNASAVFTPVRGNRIVRAEGAFVTIDGQHTRVRSAAGDAEHIRRLCAANPSLSTAQIGALAKWLDLNDGSHGLVPPGPYRILPPRKSIYHDWRMVGESLEYQHWNGRMLILVNGAIVPQVRDDVDPLTGAYRPPTPAPTPRREAPISRLNAGLVLVSAVVDLVLAVGLVICAGLSLESSRYGVLWFRRWVVLKLIALALGGYAFVCWSRLIPAGPRELIVVWTAVVLIHLLTAALIVLALQTFRNPVVLAHVGLNPQSIRLFPDLGTGWSAAVARIIPAGVSRAFTVMAAALALAGAACQVALASAGDVSARTWHVGAALACVVALGLTLRRMVRRKRYAPASPATTLLCVLFAGLLGVARQAWGDSPSSRPTSELRQQILEGMRLRRSQDRSESVRAFDHFKRIFSQTGNEVYELMSDSDPMIRQAALCTAVSYFDWMSRSTRYAKSHPEQVKATLPLIFALDKNRVKDSITVEVILWLVAIEEPGFQPLVSMLGDTRAGVRGSVARMLYESKLKNDPGCANRVQDPLDRAMLLMIIANRGEDPYSGPGTCTPVIADCLNRAIRADRATRIRAIDMVWATAHRSFEMSTSRDLLLLLAGLSDEEMFRGLEPRFKSSVICFDRSLDYGLNSSDPDIRRGALRLVTGDYVARGSTRIPELVAWATQEKSVLQPLANWLMSGPPACMSQLTELALSGNPAQRSGAELLLEKIAETRRAKAAGAPVLSAGAEAKRDSRTQASAGHPGPVTQAMSFPEGAYGPVTEQEMIRRYGAPSQIAALPALQTPGSAIWARLLSSANWLVLIAWVLILLTCRPRASKSMVGGVAPTLPNPIGDVTARRGR